MKVKLLRAWVHPDGRIIEVYEDRKVRYSGKAPRSVIFPGDLGDEWPVLLRSDVPNLNDAQWEAAPEEAGWTEIERLAGTTWTRKEGS